MKKTALIALLMIAVLAVTGCSPASYEELNIAKYVTLGTYKGLSYEAVDTAVSDYELTVSVNKDLQAKGYEETKTESITSGVVQIGDTCNIDFKGLKDGVAFEGGTASGYSLEIGSGSFIAGFEEGLVGVAIGDKVSLNLTFPKDYGKEELNGAAVVFEVTVHSVTKRKTYPAVTDAMANALDNKAHSASEYYSNKKAALEAEKVTAAEEGYKETLWSQVVTGSKVSEKLPSKLVKSAAEEFTAYYEMVATQSAYSLEEWLKANNLTMDYFKEQADTYAQSVVKSQLVAYAIAKQEGFVVTDAIYQQTAQEFATAAGYSDPGKYIAEIGEQPIRDQAVMDYAVNLVVDSAVKK